MSKYQRRHYVDLAQLISQLREDGGQSQLFAPEEVDRFARALAQLFTRDNARFDRTRFLFACGVSEDVPAPTATDVLMRRASPLTREWYPENRPTRARKPR